MSKLNEEALDYFRKQGAKGGRKGAKARMEKLTPAQRSAIAKHAVEVREQKRHEAKPASPANRRNGVKAADQSKRKK